MKTTARVSVLASLLLAPAAIASANETAEVNENIEVNQNIEINEGTDARTVTAEQVDANTVPYNTVADLDVNELRLNEIYQLNEGSAVASFEAYKNIIGSLKDAGKINPVEEELLNGKMDYLEKIADFKNNAIALSNSISLLKPTNPNLLETVPELEAQYIKLEEDLEEARTALDKRINESEATAVFKTAAFINMNDFQASLITFKTAYLKNETILQTFINDIKKPKQLIYGDSIVEGLIKKIVNQYEEKIDDSKDYKEEIQELNKQYKELLTANEQKIFDSHLLTSLDKDYTAGSVLKNALADIAAADKVVALINELDDMASASTSYKTKANKVVTEYTKLNNRQKSLVPEYEEKMSKKSETVTGTETVVVFEGHLYALEVINAIDALKISNKQEYRTAVDEVKEYFDQLNKRMQDIVKDVNFTKLEKALIDIKKAEEVENLINKIIEKNSPETTSEAIKKTREEYDALTKDQQKIVGNYKDLQNWEKYGKSTIKVDDQISSIVIENSKTFVSKTETINKNYEKLSKDEKQLITNLTRLQYILPFSTVTGEFYGLKNTSPTYKNDVAALLAILIGEKTTLTEALEKATASGEKGLEDKLALEKLQKELGISVTKLQNQLDNAEKVILLIEKANGVFTKQNEQLLAIQTARDAYNGLPKEEQKLVTNLKTLTELEKQVKQPAAVTKAIEAVDPTAKTFASKAKSAVAAFDKLSGAQKAFISDENKNRIEDFKTYLAFVDQVKALKPSDPTFQTAYDAAKKQYDKLIQTDAWYSKATYSEKIIEVIKTYEPTLKALDQAIETGNSLVEAIDNLGLLTGQAFLKEIERIEAAYNLLSPDGKKQVTNYKQFQSMKKDGTAALKVVDLINDPTIKSVDVANRGYAKKVDTALKAYEKLTSSQKAYVYNYTSGLQPYLKIYQVVEAIDNLKPAAKTYIEDVAAVRAMYNRLTNLEKQYLAPLLDKIEGAETGLVSVNEVMTMIDEARPGVEDYVQKLVAAREAYDKLARINSSYQKLVLNYKTLQEREKALKPVTTSIHQIKELEGMLARPVNEASEFVRKYNAAVKAYEAIPYESRELVYNREVLLTKIYPVAKTMEAILNIKQTSATFGQDVVKARDWYNSLSAADKALISNYKDLVNFEQTVSGGSAVDELIRQIPRTGPTQYMQAIKEARAAYDQLTAGEKKAVTLYKELQNYEKGVKNVQAAIDAIDNLQFASNLVSAYDKATKALDKLTAEQRQMVHNLNKLQSVGPAIDVYKLIASLKPSSPNYAGSVQAAYTAYNMLSSAEKQFVTNFAALQEAKNNVDLVQEVISKIAGLTSSSSNYSKQVEEAWALYNSLPSSLRKLVTNYDVLKNAQKEAEAVTKVRALISEINPNAGNFASKVKAARFAYDKLSIQQKRLVSNYFLLEDYEAKLNNSSLFF